jgi:hypothetical protein
MHGIYRDYIKGIPDRRTALRILTDSLLKAVLESGPLRYS